jgi:spore maturation protein CgeB
MVARDGGDVVEHLANLTPADARRIGERARQRVLAEHTYDERACAVDLLLRDALARKRQVAAA